MHTRLTGTILTSLAVTASIALGGCGTSTGNDAKSGSNASASATSSKAATHKPVKPVKPKSRKAPRPPAQEHSAQGARQYARFTLNSLLWAYWHRTMEPIDAIVTTRAFPGYKASAQWVAQESNKGFTQRPDRPVIVHDVTATKAPKGSYRFEIRFDQAVEHNFGDNGKVQKRIRAAHNSAFKGTLVWHKGRWKVSTYTLAWGPK